MHDPSGTPPPSSRPPLEVPPLIELFPAADGLHAARRSPPRHALALALLLLTFFCTTTLGAIWSLMVRTDTVTGLVPLLLPATVVHVWTDPDLLHRGLAFSLPALFILFCHEMGHYLACRRYGLASTLPYFLPLPAVFGTLGAFIKIRSPIRSKKELFDVGVAGPLAGFVALVPFLVIGVALSQPAPLPDEVSLETATGYLPLPGRSLALTLASRLVHGPLPTGYTLDLHPFALAAWFGLLATSLNLLPLGQLDGGHILYAVVGRAGRRLALPLWAGVGLLGLYWPGWLVWCVLLLFLGLRHPPVQDEGTRLGRGRLALAALALMILVLSFMPRPLDERAIRLDAPPAPQTVVAGRSSTNVTGPSLTSSTAM